MDNRHRDEIERIIKNLGNLVNDLEIAFEDNDAIAMEDVAVELIDEGNLLRDIATKE